MRHAIDARRLVVGYNTSEKEGLALLRTLARWVEVVAVAESCDEGSCTCCAGEQATSTRQQYLAHVRHACSPCGLAPMVLDSSYRPAIGMCVTVVKRALVVGAKRTPVLM
jgi:hypothetical protein